MRYRVYLQVIQGDWVEIEAKSESEAEDIAIRESRKVHGPQFEYYVDDVELLE